MPSIFFNDAYADIKMLDISHEDEGSPADCFSAMDVRTPDGSIGPQHEQSTGVSAGCLRNSYGVG